MSIYYVKDGKKTGPVERTELDRLVAEGTVPPTALVWQDGLEDWVSYVDFAEGSVLKGNVKTCSVCQARKSADDMVSFGQTWVCDACKPAYVQRLKEGVGANHGQVWRFRNRLVKPLDGPLPDCCAKCGAPADGKPLKRTAWYCTPWVYFLLLINIIVVLIVYLVLRKRVDLEIPLCRAHRALRRNLLIACWGVGLASIAGFFVVGASDRPEFFLIPFVTLIAACIAGSVITPVLSPTKVKDGYVWLRGAKKEYLATLPEWNPPR